MKTAVFQVNEADGATRLVCVRLPSLQAASCLEGRLRKLAGPSREIRLLGRFDAVHAALCQNEAEALILGGQGGTLALQDVVDRVLLRTRRP